ncbi:hypothetical protein JMJ55_25060 [Belnapia sp. T6]|uniref:Uncharacterized protein n=1 Tax=Belnapia mucosa TaxID=2804532 RepID=A0ABS1VAD8_9PROT|nr:hypothetical protein [Belnapia mucosa]MBL6458613.1 hypothetical protein [Belnapia mucosa]
MISPRWCRMMAAYNAGMNRRLYDAAGQLSDAARREERGAWFGSMITQAGVRPAATDLPWIIDLPALGIA